VPPIEVLPLGYGHSYIIDFDPPFSIKQYEVMIKNFLNYICVDFIQMMVGFLGG